jgi:two-component system sensor kinase FixL
LGLIGAKAIGIDMRYFLAPDLPPVIADRVQIEQVLVNLLHNAMDAMADVPERVLTLSSRQGASAIEILIADTGRGIPETAVHCLFQPFVTTKQNGMGIGLAISKSIIEAHGGEIFAEPNPGGGTRFCVRLPAAPPPGKR